MFIRHVSQALPSNLCAALLDFARGQNESLVTALFYLNDADGGETVLMPYGARSMGASRDRAARG